MNEGSLICGGTISFMVNYTLTQAITIRLANCYEDFYEKYSRLIYFLHMTPWPTMKALNRRNSHGLLPTFDLTTVDNIEAWNKMRLFLLTYEVKFSRRRQLPVLYMLVTWLSTAIYQMLFILSPNRTDNNDSTIFLLSNTFQLAIGLSLVMVVGKWTNELQGTGFSYMLRVKQTLLGCEGACFRAEQRRCYPTDAHLPGSLNEPTPAARTDDQPRLWFLFESLIKLIENEQDDSSRTHCPRPPGAVKRH